MAKTSLANALAASYNWNMQPLILNLDFAEGTDRLVATGGAWAKALKAPVHLVHILTPPTPAVDPGVYGITPVDFVETLRHSAEQRLQEYARRLPEALPEIRLEVLLGHPVDTFLEYLHRHQGIAGFVCRHANALTRFLWGNLAVKVARKAPEPALLLPEHDPQTPPLPQKLLVPVDFSPASRRALEAAWHLARAFEARQIDLLHVLLDAPPPGVPPEMLKTLEAYQAEAQQRADALLSEWVEETRRTTGAESQALLLEGLPTEIIPKTARDGGYHLLVMARRGQSPAERVLLGSVVERVIETLPIPLYLTAR